MKVGPLSVTLHRTVRVADGRSPANLPPSLGLAKVSRVADFREQCPATWEDSAVFVPLHDTEALWIAFSAPAPVAVLLGAGGINALTGEKLGLTLSAGNYMAVPPQPWIDGWKSDDGNVYQFVATPYKGGDGLSVGEQILGQESVSGGIGIAVFESTGPLKPQSPPTTGYTDGAYGDYLGNAVKGMSLNCAPGPVMRGARLSEMGVGKGGKIRQKIYADPYGADAWKAEPVAVAAIYLVDAAAYAEITGTAVPLPVGQETYGGPWYGQADAEVPDVAGTGAFTGLKTVFPAAPKEEEPTA